MSNNETHVVTGAFGYSGKYIARRLLDAGYQVRTITNSPARVNPFGDRVKACPYNFDDPEKLIESLHGASVLYNTYWVRFNHSDFTHSFAVDNTLRLFDAAKRAGIKRIVHISITNPSEDSHLEYFSGKAQLERALIESGLTYTILRPTVLFGKEDILINNIAWFLRRFPVFGVFGDGNYRLQPIYVDDLARLAVEQGQRTENCIIDATGPETFTYRGLVEEIGNIIGKSRPIVSVSPAACYFVGALIGKIVGDVTITRDEIEGLMADLLCTDSPPAGETKLTEWIRENSTGLGMRYTSELARRKNRTEPYDRL
ncbi:nucleoside-diphosphate-sugar epimerase [Candidatus Methanoperedens nitroreducens]|uniref:Nucleoside-diphosphate-sugar epimerase n=1 Tax=Candidatus Methanoperedens nitratireducens TaxID=1392998 RepID=A0A062V7Z4_9EURY|nr:NAD(P)H-binding protein [Candidatus Methanoperedens nitroreducens]KCZ71475.1 nucleoside-diphosphate-sugar epimerase [Candidatus Methanoperedens nitroreducens]MDJ1421104.1 NAD(P)H-binding protein [Candidatus Methanoperedens sp.]